MSNKLMRRLGKLMRSHHWPDVDIGPHRLKNFFLTCKDLPGRSYDAEITHTPSLDDTHLIIRRSIQDYQQKSDCLRMMLSNV
jgi:hypothetical protein